MKTTGRVAQTVIERMKGGNVMNIIEHVSVPKRVKEFALRLNQECEKKPVQNMVFTIGGKAIPSDALGGYFPDLDMIAIYVDKCLSNLTWMDYGVSYITCVWLNLLSAVGHEITHVWQLEDEPKLIAHKELPPDYEKEAFEIAIDIIDEFSEFLQPPRIEEMEWVGQEITNMLNKLFVSNPSKVQEMLEFNGKSIGGEAAVIAVMTGKYEDEFAIGRLLQLIDEGRLGCKIKNKHYLTFSETIGLFNSNHVEG
jgi:hypothetical protein